MKLKKILASALLGVSLFVPFSMTEAAPAPTMGAVASAARTGGGQLTADHYYNKGWTLHKKHLYAQAIAAYTKAIEMDPNYVEAYNNRALIYCEQKKNDLAMADYTQAISIRTDYELVYYNRGNLYIDLGMYQEAFDDYSRAIEIKENFPDAYYNRSIARTNLGDEEGAREDMNRYRSYAGR